MTETQGAKSHRRRGQIGEGIRSRRLEIGLSLDDLSFSSGVGVHWLSRMETGRTQPDAQELSEIAHALRISVPALCGGANAATL